ncbi:voltage-dependent calcium channel gamma-3 subunit-like [Branchiostoma floridae]|uniref:Voltage-dependent calcium channel gamma-3 subunit-like n=1 Tax=Branchiostoma floridae TaxID=7739 RepID=A0A9J7M7R9_BRAFL|nr:voltage-dependent calcium channel gamma-3 subunit-like [Branchiostoma floridae]XP_035696292.1 voltage-dependent calcium channel gamma-3 subunit-like [Branchiostoma floridae]
MYQRDQAIKSGRGIGVGRWGSLVRIFRMAQCGKRPLMLVTTVCSTASFALLAIAMGTDFWLFSQEAMFTPRPNGTVKLAANSGLWNECIRRQDAKKCKRIDWFPDDFEFDRHSTEFILRTIRSTGAFTIASLVIKLLGGIINMGALFDRRRLVLSLITGVVDVIAGLCNLVGLIIFVSMLHKPHGDTSNSKYFFGWSFYCAAASFAGMEISGVSAVYWYSKRERDAWRHFCEESPAKEKSLFAEKIDSLRHRTENAKEWPPYAVDIDDTAAASGDISTYELPLRNFSRDPTRQTYASSQPMLADYPTTSRAGDVYVCARDLLDYRRQPSPPDPDISARRASFGQTRHLSIEEYLEQRSPGFEYIDPSSPAFDFEPPSPPGMDLEASPAMSCTSRHTFHGRGSITEDYLEPPTPEPRCTRANRRSSLPRQHSTPVYPFPEYMDVPIDFLRKTTPV